MEPTYQGLKLVHAIDLEDLSIRFGAYLSGIETPLPFPSSFAPARLEPTYQGLKHLPDDPVARLVPRLEPTYQGLKQPRRDEVNGLSDGLEPTYQGLKLVFSVGKSKQHSRVWSLPIRD